MFKIELFVDDKNLAEVLRATAGKVRNLSVVPVVNAVVNNNGHVQANGNGTVDLLAGWLRTQTGPLRAADFRNFATSNGLAASAYGHYIRCAVANKLVRPSGKGTGMRYQPVKGR